MDFISKLCWYLKSLGLTSSTWALNQLQSLFPSPTGEGSRNCNTPAPEDGVRPNTQSKAPRYKVHAPARVRLLFFFLLMTSTLLTLHANSLKFPGDSTKLLVNVNELPPEVRRELYRTFEELELKETTLAPADPIRLPDVSLADSILEKRNHAHSLLDRILSGQRFLESLDALSEIELPIGIIKSGGALDYSILIDRINFTPLGAVMEVYVSLELPQSGDRIAFNGKIPLSKEGGIAGIAKVSLLGDHPIQLSSTSLLTIKGTDRTYVEFDCNGFKGMSLEVEVQFSRDLIIPEDTNGKQRQSDERVKVNFITYAQNLNDLLVGVTIPPFQVKGLNGFGFEVTQAFLDWSDLANPPGIVFPPTYTSPFLETGMQNLWRGFYLQRLAIRLPPSFARRQNNQRVSVGVENMILDDQGFTGEIFAENIIEAGDMNGWAYTLDRIELGLVTNQISGFQLAGKVSIPVVKNKEGKGSQFGYHAQRGSDGNYIFAVSIADELKMSLWAADVKLFNGSSVTIIERNDKFYPKANLNGELIINLLGKGPKAKFNSIRFERMVISSEAPHFTPGNFGFGKEGQSSSVSKYPVVFSNIMVKSDADRVGLGFDLTINIGGKSEEEGFGGTASLTVWAKQDSEPIKDTEGQVIGTAKDNWKFDKVELSGVRVDIKKEGAYKLSGSITFFDADPVYGDGFNGQLSGTISEFGVNATAIFGRTEEFRYWYADALVTLKSPGVPLVPGALFATGFGGGFYSKMKQTDKASGSPLGSTQSGIFYVPDENTIGIKAIMNIGTARPEAMNGDVGLEVVMNRHGGINSVTLTGNANFMSLAALGEGKMKELAKAGAAGKLSEKLSGMMKGQVFGSMKLHFDNVNDVFHGNLEIYVNVAGGLVKGVSPGNKAGWAVLHFERKDWYVLIGTPDQPIGLEVAKIFQAKSYFMIGKNLPGSPPPPQQVSEILGGIDLDYMRDFNALESGTGFAFGLHFIVDTGDLNFLMFYGRFAAGTGVDFMLKDYGTNYHCEGSSGPIGINGWYANGQAYAFVQGKIGIKVRLKFYRGNFDILSIGAAAILQAKGPNPFWMKGTVGGYYSILGGLVKGKCKFDVTIGKVCKIIERQDPLEDIAMIGEITPESGEGEVDVFISPQAAFNIPMEKEFSITDKESRRHRYRGVLKEFRVTSKGVFVNGTLRWNDEMDVVAFESADVLPPKQEVKILVKVAFEEFMNGAWKVAIFDGQPSEESADISFTTGPAPDYIPASNVELAYPLAGQYNLYPKEHNQGFITLKKGQRYLFQQGTDWIQKAYFTATGSGQLFSTDVAYDNGQKKVSYPLPPDLTNGVTYTAEIVSLPRQAATVDNNVQKVEKELVIGEDAGQAVLTTKNIEGNIALREAKVIYTTYFRTSLHDTFAEKAQSISLADAFRKTVFNDVSQLAAYIRGAELFDDFEISGYNNSGPLIRFEAILDGNDWYTNYVHPLVYEGYPLLGTMKVYSRDVNTLGLPPVRSMLIDEKGYNPRITESNLTEVFPAPSIYSQIRYDLMVPMYSDYKDIQTHVANRVTDNPSLMTDRMAKLIMNRFPIYRYGKYRFKLQYVIPGINKTPGSYEWEIFNPIPD